MPNQARLWSDENVIADRREKAEEFMGRQMEMSAHEYNDVDRRVAAFHLAWVKTQADSAPISDVVRTLAEAKGAR